LVSRVRPGIVAPRNRRDARVENLEHQDAVVPRPPASGDAPPGGGPGTECPREADAFEAVAFGRWPAHVTRELLAHVAGCSVCRDVVDVAAPLQDDRRLLMRAIDPPGAGIVW